MIVIAYFIRAVNVYKSGYIDFFVSYSKVSYR